MKREKNKQLETHCDVPPAVLLDSIVVGLLPIIVTTLGPPSLPNVVTVCVTNGGAVVITSPPEPVSVTMTTVGNVVLFIAKSVKI